MNNLSDYFYGDDQVINKLFDNYKDKSLSNSIIFLGNKGVGKATLTFFLIKKIFKYLDKKNNFDSIYNMIENNIHSNIKYVTKQYDDRTKKINTFIVVDQIRSLQKFLVQTSIDNLPKFVIIDSADDLNINAANALLKNLEEPQINTYFILITNQLSSLLPTIRSRCIKFFIKKPSANNFSNILNKNNYDLNEEQINFLYFLSNGSPGVASKILDDDLNHIYLLILKIFINNNSLTSEIVEFSSLVSEYNNEQFKIVLFFFRFILITIIKIKLRIKFSLNFIKCFDSLIDMSNHVHIQSAYKILEYLNNNENDLFVYNLDKKIFTLNIFESLKIKYE